MARPLIVLGTAVEKHHVRERLRDVFTFGPQDEFQLYPVAYVDWGFRPSAGAYFSWQRVGGGSGGHVRVMSGGPGYWDARGLWRLPDEWRGPEVVVRYTAREDAVFMASGATVRIRAGGMENGNSSSSFVIARRWARG